MTGRVLLTGCQGCCGLFCNQLLGDMLTCSAGQVCQGQYTCHGQNPGRKADLCGEVRECTSVRTFHVARWGKDDSCRQDWKAAKVSQSLSQPARCRALATVSAEAGFYCNCRSSSAAGSINCSPKCVKGCIVCAALSSLQLCCTYVIALFQLLWLWHCLSGITWILLAAV